MVRSHPLETLSIDAVRYGQELGPLEVPAMAARLYHFNTQPVTASALANLKAIEQAAASGALGASAGSGRGSASGMVAAGGDHDWVHWIAASPAEAEPDETTEAAGRNRPSNSPAQYKLYLSPAVVELRDTLLRLGDLLPHIDATALKRARGTSLLRPDKVVLHFAGWEELVVAAELMHEAFQGVAPHGVPFTAPLFDDGLISWGVDPPAELIRAAGAPVSWRTWVTTRVAEALVRAMDAVNPGLEPWQVALNQAARDGLNIPAFSPGESLIRPGSEWAWDHA